MAQNTRGQQRRPGAPRAGEGRGQDLARFEKQLANYLQQRIKPGLNSGAIPLLARSIAKDLAEERSRSNGAAKAEEPVKEDEGIGAEDFEDEMHDLQAELGKGWIVQFSVKDGDAWLTAEKDDGSQHLEAQTADVLVKAAKLLKKGGGRTG